MAGGAGGDGQGGEEGQANGGRVVEAEEEGTDEA